MGCVDRVQIAEDIVEHEGEGFWDVACAECDSGDGVPRALGVGRLWRVELLETGEKLGCRDVGHVYRLSVMFVVVVVAACRCLHHRIITRRTLDCSIDGRRQVRRPTRCLVLTRVHS